MREIKFRGKREDNGEWVVGYTRYSNKKSIIMVDLLEQEDYWVSSETVGQYTGLQDRNGVEIYEGDIVAFEDSDGGYEYPDLAVNTGIVEYGELGFYFTNRIAVEMDDFYIKDGRCDEVEVIGNIYENRELLEVTE